MQRYDSLKKLVQSRFLPYVEKPMRYTGGELNAVIKDPATVTLQGVICFPDLYEIGMSYTGLQLLYHVVNKHPQWALSRAFCPWSDAEKLMRELSIPLYTLEYFSPVKDADWVGFTFQWELQYTNVLTMLDLAGIPLESSARGEDDPIIIAGGPCSGNPEPMALFIDAFVIGDGEDVLQQLCSVLESEKKRGGSRTEKLLAISALAGVYVPSLWKIEKKGRYTIPLHESQKTIQAARIPELAHENYPVAPIVPLMNVVHHRLTVEVQRGCTRGCRFCAAGFFYRPVRERSSENLFESIVKGMEYTGWRDVGLLSLSTSDYSQFEDLLEKLSALRSNGKIDVSLPSTRIDALSDTQLDLLQKVSPASSITIAPEAASERLRRVINKDFTNDAIFTTAKRLLERNVQTLKLYFMIGLPTETDQDIEAIISMVSEISQIARKISGRKMINVAISPFSPKPHTPFQWEAAESPVSLTEKGRMIKYSLRALKNVKVSYRSADQTFLESIIARGDRTISLLIKEAWSNGARLDGWDEFFNLQRWHDSASKIGIEIQDYCKAIEVSQPLPWGFITAGAKLDYLLEEKNKAYSETAGYDCRNNQCYDCGACGPQSGVATKLASKSTILNVLPLPKKESVSANQKNFAYRYFYRKGESVRFLGHLDMVDIFQRAFLASGYPLVYSKGFNPHARLSFGPPLPLGAQGEREAFDALFSEEIAGDPLIINRWLPPEIRIYRCIPLSISAPALNLSIVAAQYLFYPKDSIQKEIMEQTVAAIKARDSIVITIVKKGESREKNIRPLIFGLSVQNDESGYYWDAILSLSSNATCKPLELAQLLIPYQHFFDFTVVRNDCFIERAGSLVPVA